jgi:hypothetical protein
MKYVRLHADKNGNTHFEDATLKLDEADYRPPAPLVFVSHAYQTDGVQFIRLPSGWAADAIHPPKKQFLICLKGHIEVTAGDGEKRSFGPGDSVLWRMSRARVIAPASRARTSAWRPLFRSADLVAACGRWWRRAISLRRSRARFPRNARRAAARGARKRPSSRPSRLACARQV